MSPYRWLLERGIDRAKALLVTSDLSIADIAARAGFSDQAAFTRAFARIVEDSPGGGAPPVAPKPKSVPSATA